MKVKVLREYTPNWLEDKINDWLKQNKKMELIDIKFSSFLSERHRESIGCYTAMIIYKEVISFEEININEEDIPF